MAVVVNRWDETRSLERLAAAAVEVGEICHIDTNGKFALSDADASGTRVPWGVCVKRAAAGKYATCSKYAHLSGVAPGGSTPAAGDLLYLSDTPGAFTKTAPASATDTLWAVGVLVSATEAVIDIPSQLPIVLQGAATTTINL